jgi:hypothetical protein
MEPCTTASPTPVRKTRAIWRGLDLRGMETAREMRKLGVRGGVCGGGPDVSWDHTCVEGRAVAPFENGNHEDKEGGHVCDGEIELDVLAGVDEVEIVNTSDERIPWKQEPKTQQCENVICSRTLRVRDAGVKTPLEASAQLQPPFKD